MVADTADFRGGGGVVMTFDLPMHEVYANQLLKGDLEPADEAAREYLRSLRPEPEPDEPEVVEPEPEPVPVPSEPPPRAGPGSARGNWAAWAEGQGVEVSDEDTRDDIIAKLEDA